MDNMLVTARKSIIEEWSQKTFFLYETKYYYLDNMKDVLAFLIKTDDKENLVIRKYLEALLAKECYEYSFFANSEKIRDYTLINNTSLSKLLNGEIEVAFADDLFKNIFTYLKNSILPCPYPKNYCENIINFFYNQVKENFISMPTQYGTTFKSREILNYWLELAVRYHCDAQFLIRVDTNSEYLEDSLISNIADVISEAFYSCNHTLQRGLFAYICELYNYDDELTCHKYDIEFLGNNTLTGNSEDYNPEIDQKHILAFIVEFIRDMVIEKCAEDFCLDDCDSFSYPENLLFYDVDINEENTYVKECITEMLDVFMANNPQYKNYFQEFLAAMNGEFSELSQATFSFGLIRDLDEGSHNSIYFYLDDSEFTIYKGGYENNECGGDSYTDWIWNEPLTEYVESDEAEYRLDVIRDFVSDIDIRISIE